MKLLNVGPVEWFSPHFVYPHEDVVTENYDPIKQRISLIEYCRKSTPDLLWVFRGDLVRYDLHKLEGILQVEFSSEIYPDYLTSRSAGQIIAFRKFFHCMREISPNQNLIHYDVSRKNFLECIGVSSSYQQLPVNITEFSDELRDIDVLFFGRASIRRSQIFNPLKEKRGFRFVWIENGLEWSELAKFISRSRVVVNLSADGIDNFEPRILLALAGGAKVVTERSAGLLMWLDNKPIYKSMIYFSEPNSSSFLESIAIALGDADSTKEKISIIQGDLSSASKLKEVLKDISRI
ncbi:hypothetical protein [Pseudomonas protegens]|uniref:hypothetical protein n=1 Tax=Pseudomonas protegens TaxID=380021 RepID=UPI0027593F4F|nr:hypothetical protein [Pseudomonas protegens]MDP9530030.1 hypothetical protein [Pseudomonas protegens]